MKKLILLLFLVAGAAFGQCTALVLNPLTGKLDCTGATGPAGPTGATGATGAPGTGNNAYCADATGSTTTYTCPSPSPTVSTLTGLLITFVPQTTNSGTATVNVASLGGKTLKLPDCSTNVPASGLTGGTAYIFSYNGTNFCQSFGAAGAAGTNGAGYAATSTTSLAIGLGSTAFTTQAGLAYSVGAFTRASSAANGANYMQGLVTAYSGTTLTINVTESGGSGTHADWNINLVGNTGATGAPGATGAAEPETIHIVQMQLGAPQRTHVHLPVPESVALTD